MTKTVSAGDTPTRYGTVKAGSDDALAIEAIVLDYIETAYSHRIAGRPEPSITAAEVSDYLLQHGRCPQLVKAVRRWRYQATYQALQRLVRAGKLEASMALAGRCYNPKGGR